MAHAGTPTDLAKQPATSTTNGPWQALLVAIALVAVVAVAAFVGTSLAAKGAVSPAVIPAADHSLDQIEAQRGAAVTLSTDAYLNSILDNAHATPYIHGPAFSTDEYLNNILDRAHATPFAVGVTPQMSATSGTFHPGWQPVAPIKRDRIGGRPSPSPSQNEGRIQRPALVLVRQPPPRGLPWSPSPPVQPTSRAGRARAVGLALQGAVSVGAPSTFSS